MAMRFEVLLWVVILVSLALAIASSKHRKLSLIAVGVAVAAVVTIILVASKSEVATPPATSQVQRPQRVDFEALHIEKLDKEDPQAKARIALSEIRFDQI